MNVETRAAYHIMFHKLFGTIERVARRKMHFSHIHGSDDGISVVTVDMCMKQGPGETYGLHMQFIC